MRLRNFFGMTFLVGAAAAGCGNDALTFPNVNPNPQAAKDAVVNIVHASPDASAVDVYVDMKKAATVDFRKSTGNVKLASGAHKLELRTAGAAETAMPIYATDLNLPQESKTLFTVLGRAGDKSGATKLTVSTASFGTPDPSGVKLRLVHASPSAPRVDLAGSDKKLVITHASFGRASGYSVVATADLPKVAKLGLRAADASYDLATVTLPSGLAAGAVVTAIAVGETDPLSDTRFLDVLALKEDSGELVDLDVQPNSQDTEHKASFVVIHASPDAPPVDIVYKSNGSMLAPMLAYQKASKRVELDGGEHAIDVRLAGTTTVALTTKLKLLPGLAWTLYATGLASGMGDKALKVMAVPRLEGATETTWRLIHVSPGDFALDVLDTTNKPAVSGLAYTRASAYLEAELAAGTMKFQTNEMTKTVWNVVVPQGLADQAQGQVVSLLATGIKGDMTKPFTVVAVIESSATKDMAAVSTNLMTTRAP